MHVGCLCLVWSGLDHHQNLLSQAMEGMNGGVSKKEHGVSVQIFLSERIRRGSRFSEKGRGGIFLFNIRASQVNDVAQRRGSS